MFILIFVLTTVIAPGNKPVDKPVDKVVDKSPVKATSLLDLSKLNKLQLEEICNQVVLGNFASFYQNWIENQLEGMSMVTPTRVELTLKTIVDDHIKQIQDYITNFNSKKPFLKNYAILKFELEMRYLISKISDIIGDAFSFELPNNLIAERIGEDYPKYADLLSKIRQLDVTSTSIENFRQLFFEEYQPTPAKLAKDMNPKIGEIKIELVSVLMKILNVYSDPNPDSRFNKLTSADHEQLQRFFDAFFPLIELKTLKDFVIGKTIGGSKMIQTNHLFFTADLFNHLLLKSPTYDGIIEKDRFLTEFNPDIHLIRFHESVKHALSTWPVLKAFDGLDYKLILDKSNEQLPAKQKRKRVLIFYNIYKVFIITRSSGVIKPSDKQELVPMMETLFKWIAVGDSYEDPKLSDDGQLLDEHKNVKEFLSKEDYSRYYIPMLVEICKLIPDCSMTKKNKELKIGDQFVKLGQFEDIFRPEQLFDIPKDFKQALEELATVKETHNFLRDMEVDITLNDINPSVLSDPFGDRIDIVPIDNPRSPLKAVLSPRGQHSPRDQTKLNSLQTTFNDRFKKILSPAEVDPNSPMKLQRYIETVFDSNNIKKKNVSITLLFKLLLSLDLNIPQNRNLIDITMTTELNQIRAQANYESLSGLRNFFFRTLLSGNEYEPIVMDDQISYSLDLVIFLYYNYIDQISMVNKDATLNKADKEKKISHMTQKSIEYKKIILLNNVDDTQLAPIRKGWKDMRRSLLQMGLPASKRTLPIDPLILEKLMGVKFLYELRGFFDYYAIIEKQAKAVAVNYHRIYMQFYQFIGHIRRLLVHEVEDPDTFVMEKLTECLDFTKRMEVYTDELIGDAVCKFSHRKYAEMLFFYRSYVLNKQKQTVEFDSKEEGAFNVHTRSFLAFSESNSVFSNVIAQECSVTKTLPICISHHIFKEVMKYVSNEVATLDVVDIYLNSLPNQKSFATKINVINGFESVYFWVEKSSPVNYSKFSSLFQFGLVPNSPLKKKLKFETADKNKLSDYLSRTFKKSSISDSERNLAKIILAILHFTLDKTNKTPQETLTSFLSFGGHFIPYYIKLFMQYALKKEHFDLFADIIIDKEISIELVKINDPNDDYFYLSFVAMTQALDESAMVSQGTDILRKALRQQYSMAFKLCEASSQSIVSSNSNLKDSDDFDLLDLLLEENDKEEKKQIDTEDKFFTSFNSKIGSPIFKAVDQSFSQSPKESERLSLINSAQSSIGEYQTSMRTVQMRTINVVAEVMMVSDDQGTTGKIKGPIRVYSSTEILKHDQLSSPTKMSIGGNAVINSQGEFLKGIIQTQVTDITEQLLQKLALKPKSSSDSFNDESIVRVVEMIPTIDSLFKTSSVVQEVYTDEDEEEGWNDDDDDEDAKDPNKMVFSFNKIFPRKQRNRAQKRANSRERKDAKENQKRKDKGTGVINQMNKGGNRGNKGGRKLVL